MTAASLGSIGTPLVRAPLRQAVRRVVLQGILHGALAPGGDVNEAELAAQLGVSRTPLREALLALEAEGFLQSSVGRGFRVAPLIERDVEEIYPVLWTLEGQALQSGPLPSGDLLRELTELNTELDGSAKSPEKALRLDRQWHQLLVSGCTNRRLLEAIRELKDLAERYELAYMRHSGFVPFSAKQHRAILTALRKKDVAAAVAHLVDNWRVSQEFLIPWIREATRTP
ncbi:MAG: GntR family transcriptional regulator [Candidatus Eiseniibacteriota bacterium]